VTPTLSLDGDHPREMLFVDTAVTVRFDGVVGA
jgi:hypothetical protein